MVKEYRIAVSCVGSGVGQSIINSCRLSRLPLYTVGLGTNPFAYGAYDCDTMDVVPSIYDETYVDQLIGVLKKHRADLVIPGLDDEALILSRATAQLEQAGIKVVTAGAQLIELCRDKERMSNDLNPIVNIFVRSFDKKSAIEAVAAGEIDFPLIAKPRGGNASRGIEIILDEHDLMCIGELQIVQELAIPCDDDPNFDQYMQMIRKRINPQLSEISIQLLTDPAGELMARMASLNKLSNGVPIEIVPFENDSVWNAADRLHPVLKEMGLSGPLNIQGRLTNKGLKLFEMNPRFTGITGLRAIMGFNEVEACIKKWLDIPGPATPLKINQNNFGIRQTADKVVPLECNEEVRAISATVNKRSLETKKTVLVTGAGGCLGHNLIVELLKGERYEIQAMDVSKEILREKFPGEAVECFSIDDLRQGRISLGQVDRLIHCAFGRPHCSAEQIADSLSFTSELFTQATTQQIPAIINISSQAVYGLSRPPPWTEELPAAPETPFAQANFATELMAESGRNINNHVRFTSLRLSSLSGGRDGFAPDDLLGRFAEKALKGEIINIMKGSQLMERLDVRDAIGAIIALLGVDPGLWDRLYNVGPGTQYDICELAEKTAQSAKILTGDKKSKVRVEQKGTPVQFGMDIVKIKSATGWAPRYTIDDTIRSVVTYLNTNR